ncbi:LptA/OstA family protein [Deinococcus multiflagellatus]|uniref:LptA/OstA family protein n=1 Tax=Deinococcus multiflagellatus TaxID=1656887 RepID=A0ABW1ZKI2_9DEIO|nr:LptA/OstA family protein [Deinococcus multiflagellatus]MBZ9712270.1 LptA/OstA family protein [Deinococcus multiflagellatus]
MSKAGWTWTGRATLALLLGLGAGMVWAQQAPGTPPPATQSTPQVPPEDLAPQEPGAEQSSTELVRRSEKDGKERRILIVKTGTRDDTGVFTFCQPTESDPEDAPTLAVFSETDVGGVRITIDKNVIQVPLALVTQLPPKGDEEGSDGRVEASAGTARFLDEAPPGKTDRLSRCGVETSPKPAPNTVLVTQGRTELKGQKLVYDSTDGIARIDGPITFQRRSDKDALSGQSERIEVSVDEEKTTLVGNVVLNSEGGRISKAARVEYDDTRNVARLYGTPEQPAESVKGQDVLRAGTILYDLDRNEVRAVKAEGGTITGEFVDAEPAPGTAAPAPVTPPGTGR